ncbi:MAG: hypothetical protein RL732_924, partial [Bacteroidota bacterium]
LCATTTAGFICRMNLSTAAPLVMQEFGLSQIAMGRVFSSFYLGYAFLQVPSGILADRWGTRKIYRWAISLWILFTLLQALVGWGSWQQSLGVELLLLMALRFLLGASSAPAYPAASKGVSDWVPAPLRGMANGVVLSSIGLGSALAPLLVSGLMITYGWRVALLASALPALLVALAWMRAQSPPSKIIVQPLIGQGRHPEYNSNAHALKSRPFLLLTLSYSLQGYVGYIFISWFYIYLVQERHFGLLSGAWMSSLPWALSIVSIPLGGWLADRLAQSRLGTVWGRRIIPMLGLGLSGLLISVGAHTDSAVVAAITLAFATAFVLCVEGPSWAMMNHIAGQQSGRAGGIMNMGCNICGLLSPVITPVLATYVGWETTLHLAALIAVFAALLWWGIGSTDVLEAPALTTTT